VLKFIRYRSGNVRGGSLPRDSLSLSNLSSSGSSQLFPDSRSWQKVLRSWSEATIKKSAQQNLSQHIEFLQLLFAGVPLLPAE
jgi:hypothetical protein